MSRTFKDRHDELRPTRDAARRRRTRVETEHVEPAPEITQPAAEEPQPEPVAQESGL